jgi:maltose phosphorylase
MNKYLKIDPWRIIEENFNPANNRVSESLFSIGNGRMGQRANFEEQYSGDTLQGTYIGGVYYPDKTKVGWWKNGYPEYFAKVINAPNWIGLNLEFNGKPLDLAKCKILGFNRILNMKEGYLERNFRVEIKGEGIIEAEVRRFISIADTEVGAIRYNLIPINFRGTLAVTGYLDGDVSNEDANYNEKFWDEVSKQIKGLRALLISKTRKLDFLVSEGMEMNIFRNGIQSVLNPVPVKRNKYVACKASVNFSPDDQITIYKYAAVLSSLNHPPAKLKENTYKVLDMAVAKGFEQLMSEQAAAWAEKWEKSDIVITGDNAAQQGIRFNIFQLNQTYSGEDERLNIGPKGFTGEKYGGSTYWDTEAFCLPFYLCSTDQKVSRSLLIYRYKHLDKAIVNAEKLGFKEGAALYPMVTMNGEECHNEWEITFEEIHRNGAIAFAIFNYVRHTNDRQYLADYGLEVLIAISRFWSQRITWSDNKKQFIILGVTGPNEYENNVNNNWYTSRFAVWTLRYTMEIMDFVRNNYQGKYNNLIKKLKFRQSETERWQKIIEQMYFPYDEKLNLFLQQEGYLDKEQIMVAELDPQDRPLNQKWSWDRILRSCFIKQADVLQGMYFFEDEFDDDTLERHYNFYEPRTVHESSLSACIHSVMASRIGEQQKAYELYLRTARLDLDDYNDEADQGCHITSMAGTWLAIVEGFGGKRIKNGKLCFNPAIPENWKSYSFKICFRGVCLEIIVTREKIRIKNKSEKAIHIMLYGEEQTIGAGQEISKKTNADPSTFFNSGK